MLIQKRKDNAYNIYFPELTFYCVLIIANTPAKHSIQKRIAFNVYILNALKHFRHRHSCFVVRHYCSNFSGFFSSQQLTVNLSAHVIKKKQ